MFYLHPWEIDAAQPRFNVPFLTGLRHCGRLGGTWGAPGVSLRESRLSASPRGLACRRPPAHDRRLGS